MGDIHSVASESRRRLKLEACFASVLLSVLFLVVYSGTNWLTSQRQDVGTWYYEWERMIPFVPLMVIPYMSIDLFFVVAPFLCKDRRELHTFASRITFAILVGGACFLIMPLQLARDRPPLGGWIGATFGWFFAADLPYNLCPSLHIALRTILADTYRRHTQGYTKVAVQFWFFLIGLSTLLTYQHHVVDVIGGFVLSAICFYVVPSFSTRHAVIPNRRVGVYYLFSSLVTVGFVALTWPKGNVIVWPAITFLIATTAYFGLGPGIYRKIDGRLPLSTRIVLAPLIIGQQLSLMFYRRQCRAWDEATSQVWIGRKLTHSEADDAIHKGVVSVLDVTTEFSEVTPFLSTNFMNVPILDLTAPTLSQLDQCVTFISDNVSQGVVYVHCKVGYSRSAAVVGAYLMKSGAVHSADEAMAHLRSIRPTIVIRPEAVDALRRYEIERLH